MNKKAIIIIVLFFISVSFPIRAAGSEDLTLIIDPGHGGDDGGAVSITGKKESEINLDISLRCEQLAAFMGYNTVITRYFDTIDYPPEILTIRERKVWDQHERLRLANSYANAFFISIHQNKYSSAEPRGAQVFYNGSESGKYAVILTEEIFKYINRDKKRTAKAISKDIYLLNKVECPAVLIECGFLSNIEEAHKLESDEHQKLLSVLIIGSFCRYSCR